ncbi:hypothetical protein V7S43_004378 [Phytophthora oleae]|uniref:Uncharacterized protein n=1 Tax=Phytophthora oleae TaxID=2107226 RepID=A0ABD3FUK7_9STRA
MDPGHINPETSAPFTLQEQLRLLDEQEPGRAQWSYCATDEDRIAQLPEDIRNKLILAGQRVQFSELWNS